MIRLEACTSFDGAKERDGTYTRRVYRIDDIPSSFWEAADPKAFEYSLEYSHCGEPWRITETEWLVAQTYFGSSTQA